MTKCAVKILFVSLATLMLAGCQSDDDLPLGHAPERAVTNRPEGGQLTTQPLPTRRGSAQGTWDASPDR